MLKLQKVTFFSLLFLIIAVIFLGLWQLKMRVSDPFKLKGDDSFQLAKTDQLNEEIDTDGDGLSDYNEVFLYGTSPYLEDTDSDGISDYEEIARGTDPNCPEGSNCFVLNEFFAEPENTFDNSLGYLELEEDLEEGLGDISLSEEINESELKQALAGEIGAQELRQLLLESGADKELLDQISDEDLLTSYQEVLNNQNE
jgi:hypothetical protein